MFEAAVKGAGDPFEIQSVNLPGAKEKKGETIPRINSLEYDVLKAAGPTKTGFELKEWDTCWHLLQRGVRGFPDEKFHGTRVYTEDGSRGDYVWETYQEVGAKVEAVGRGLVTLGLKARANVGIFGINRAEWSQAQYALYSQSMRCVSLYATLGPEAVSYIIGHADLEAMFVGSKKELTIVLDYLREAKKEAKSETTLKHLIIFDHQDLYKNVSEKVDPKDVEAAKALGVQLLGFSSLVKSGTQSLFSSQRSEAIPLCEPKPDDLAFIMYTSGTTGVPKGAQLLHRNIAFAATCASLTTRGDRLLSYLPLAHIFESVVQANSCFVGAQIGFYQGNIKKLVDDMKSIKPTVFAGVPRVYQKFYDKVMAGIAGQPWYKRWYINSAYSRQTAALNAGTPRIAKYDNRIFNPLRSGALGLGECRLCVTGAAPCPAYLLNFMRVVLMVDVVQGYGMTENAAACTLMRMNDGRGGHVGTPSPGIQIKLVDVPDMKYLSTDKQPRGEVVTKGPSVFAGYYKNPEKTAECLSQDGWLSTGDVGRWNDDGTLSIIDRKKNIFKLSQGEYIAVEKVEAAFQKLACVGQLWVYGNSYKPFIVAVVVPDASWFAETATAKHWWTSTAALLSPEFVKDFKAAIEKNQKAIAAVIMESMAGAAKDAKLKGFEKVRGIIVEGTVDPLGQGFNETNNLMTPTFKLRRPFLVKHYREQLKALYTQLGDAPKPDEDW